MVLSLEAFHAFSRNYSTKIGGAHCFLARAASAALMRITGRLARGPLRHCVVDLVQPPSARPDLRHLKSVSQMDEIGAMAGR